jgi:hypothetical protein
MNQDNFNIQKGEKCDIVCAATDIVITNPLKVIWTLSLFGSKIGRILAGWIPWREK